MARVVCGGKQSSGYALLGKPWQDEHAKPICASVHTKLCVVLSIACVLSCAYAMSLLFISTTPCGDGGDAQGGGANAGGYRFLATQLQNVARYQQLLALGSDSESFPKDRESVEKVVQGDIAIEDRASGVNVTASLGRIVFGIAASSKLWSARKHYVRQWWDRRTMRGFVWLERPVNGTWDVDAPPFKVSANTSRFRYNFVSQGKGKGNRAALRLARIVTETFRLGLPEVDWFVMGDDDTVFFTDNLVRVLAGYDPKKMHYIGSQSESHVQNTLFSYGMAYGGGGFAISYPLAKALATTQDACLHRYPELFGSDDRMHACITELGVPITKNQGFHQFDILGNPMGLLAAHPLTPLLSIHHLDVIGSLFPKMSRLVALRHFMKAARVEQASMLQQTITYSRQRQYSISISSGYVVRVYRGFMAPWELEEVPRTFLSWYGSKKDDHFPFNVREIPDAPCEKPTLFFMAERTRNQTSQGLVETVYTKQQAHKLNLTGCDEGISSVERIRVRSVPPPYTSFEARRLCGKVEMWRNDTIDIALRPCQQGELVIGSDEGSK